MRLKGGEPGGPGSPGGATNAQPTGATGGPPKTGNSGGEGSPARGAAGDMQQMLSRLPASGLRDFQKGDAVMIVSTEGDPATAITVLGGVEPILSATPKGSKDMVLSPWSLSAPEGGG